MVAEDQLQRTVCRACTPKENLRLGLKIHKSTSGVLGEKERKENQRRLLEKNCLRKSHVWYSTKYPCLPVIITTTEEWEKEFYPGLESKGQPSDHAHCIGFSWPH